MCGEMFQSFKEIQQVQETEIELHSTELNVLSRPDT